MSVELRMMVVVIQAWLSSFSGLVSALGVDVGFPISISVQKCLVGMRKRERDQHTACQGSNSEERKGGSREVPSRAERGRTNNSKQSSHGCVQEKNIGIFVVK